MSTRIERLLQAIDVRTTLEALGRPSGAQDLRMAAHALHERCIRVTNNEPQFVHLPGF